MSSWSLGGSEARRSICLLKFSRNASGTCTMGWFPARFPRRAVNSELSSRGVTPVKEVREVRWVSNPLDISPKAANL